MISRIRCFADGSLETCLAREQGGYASCVCTVVSTLKTFSRRNFDIGHRIVCVLIVAQRAKVEAYAPRRRSVACGIPRIRDGLMADAMRESNPRPREPRPRVRTDRVGKPTLGLAQRPH